MNHGGFGRSRNRHYKSKVPVYPCTTRKMTEEEKNELSDRMGVKSFLDNHANQCNPNNPNYGGDNATHSPEQNNNHSNQLNPNNEEFIKMDRRV